MFNPMGRRCLRAAHQALLLRTRDQTGQATAEYALLTGAVALILGLVAAWAAGTGRIAALFDAVFDGLIRAAG